MFLSFLAFNVYNRAAGGAGQSALMAKLAAVSSAHLVVCLRNTSVWTGGVNDNGLTLLCTQTALITQLCLQDKLLDLQACNLFASQQAWKCWSHRFCMYMQCKFRKPAELVQ